MSTTANRGAGALSRFAHFAGIVSKPKAAEPATDEDVADVQDDVDDVKDDVQEVKDDLDELEQRVEDVEEEQDDAPETPAERAAYQKGRQAERARAGAILSARVAAANRNLALHLAFETSVPAKQAIATLKASADGAPKLAMVAPLKPARLDALMGTKPPINVGTGADAGKPSLDTHDGLAAHAIAVAKRVGIVK